MISFNGKRRLCIRLVILAMFASASFAGLIVPQISRAEFIAAAQTTPTPKRKSTKTKALPKTAPTLAPTPDPEQARFANFKHQLHLDMELQCTQCHKFPTANWDKVREKSSAFPDVTDFPKHDSCLECHREQFFSGNPPAICSSCHVNPGPNDSTRFPFPNPREIFDATPRGKKAESEFKVEFPHDKHVEIVSRNTMPTIVRGAMFVSARAAGSEDSCKVCHSVYKPQGKDANEYFSPPPRNLGDGFWLKKGTFNVSPTGHTTCFTCHTEDSGIAPAPADCGTCHKVKQPLPQTDFSPELASKIGLDDKIMLLAWRRRTSSATFRHEWESHVDVGCSTCHNVTTLKTTVIATKKVAVLSCMPCHVTATTDDGGVLNAEVDARKKDPNFACVKCHLSYAKMPVPESHMKAIVEAGK